MVIVKLANQGQCEEAMGDSAAKRRFFCCPHTIDMNPLKVACCLRKLIDARLRHHDPISDKNFISSLSAQAFQSADIWLRHF